METAVRLDDIVCPLLHRCLYSIQAQRVERQRIQHQSIRCPRVGRLDLHLPAAWFEPDLSGEIGLHSSNAHTLLSGVVHHKVRRGRQLQDLPGRGPGPVHLQLDGFGR